MADHDAVEHDDDDDDDDDNDDDDDDDDSTSSSLQAGSFDDRWLGPLASSPSVSSHHHNLW